MAGSVAVKRHPAAECPSCGSSDTNKQHAPRAGTQANQHQPRIHNVSRVRSRLVFAHAVEDGPLFIANGDVGMEIIVPAGEL